MLPVHKEILKQQNLLMKHDPMPLGCLASFSTVTAPSAAPNPKPFGVISKHYIIQHSLYLHLIILKKLTASPPLLIISSVELIIMPCNFILINHKALIYSISLC